MCLLEAPAGTAGCLGVPLGEHSSPALASDTVRGRWAWTAPRPSFRRATAPRHLPPLEDSPPVPCEPPGPASGWSPRLAAQARGLPSAAWPSSSLHPWLLPQQCRPAPRNSCPLGKPSLMFSPVCCSLVSGPALWRGETADRAPTWSPRARQEACVEALPRRGHWTNG